MLSGIDANAHFGQNKHEHALARAHIHSFTYVHI